jgi:pilus assembly protein Flp/PilA
VGQTKPDGGLSHAAGRRALGRLVARPALALARDESGATAIEYGLIVSLIFLVVVGSMTAFGSHATSVINDAAQAINSAV